MTPFEHETAEMDRVIPSATPGVKRRHGALLPPTDDALTLTGTCSLCGRWEVKGGYCSGCLAPNPQLQSASYLTPDGQHSRLVVVRHARSRVP